MTRVFDEIVDFITSAPQPEQILNFKPSTAAQRRLETLLEKKREEGLNDNEKHELEQYLTIEHIMRLAKARARQRIKVFKLNDVDRIIERRVIANQ